MRVLVLAQGEGDAWRAGPACGQSAYSGPPERWRRRDGYPSGSDDPPRWDGDAKIAARAIEWGEQDSNLRRHSQRVYSPSPLTTRTSPRAVAVPSVGMARRLVRPRPSSAMEPRGGA